MIDEDKAARLVSNFNAASTKLKKHAPGKPGSTAEVEYGVAYQQLVQAGLAPQIRLKYRNG